MPDTEGDGTLDKVHGSEVHTGTSKFAAGSVDNVHSSTDQPSGNLPKGAELEPESFRGDYVLQLRDENAKYRQRARTPTSSVSGCTLNW
jgi:hypothetical protein